MYEAKFWSQSDKFEDLFSQKRFFFVRGSDIPLLLIRRI
jgi:hypothetical protein